MLRRKQKTALSRPFPSLCAGDRRDLAHFAVKRRTDLHRLLGELLHFGDRAGDHICDKIAECDREGIQTALFDISK